MHCSAHIQPLFTKHTIRSKYVYNIWAITQSATEYSILQLYDTIHSYTVTVSLTLEPYGVINVVSDINYLSLYGATNLWMAANQFFGLAWNTSATKVSVMKTILLSLPGCARYRRAGHRLRLINSLIFFWLVLTIHHIYIYTHALNAS